MKQGWNGSNHNDRFCYMRFYSLWHNYGGYWFTFILDKKMTTFTTEDRKMGADPLAIADILEFDIDPAYLFPTEGSTLIQAAYLLRMQHEEIKALKAKYQQEFDYAEKLLKEKK